jgi:acyl dehydratase
MTIDATMVGRSYTAAGSYQVGREKIREFADAIGDPNPVYRDRAAAEALGYPDVIAPPTFPIVLTMRASHQVVRDPALGLDYSKVVHGEQQFHYQRPVRAGDVLQVTNTVESIRAVGGNDILTTRGEVRTVDGELVVTAVSTVVARGTARSGAGSTSDGAA